MSEHRSRLARERAGLSIGQAAKLLGVDRGVIRQIEAAPIVDREDRAKQMAELYGVNVPWLLGEAPQHDYAWVDKTPGGDKLSSNDRDTIAEFAASMPRGGGTYADRVHRLKGSGRR